MIDNHSFHPPQIYLKYLDAEKMREPSGTSNVLIYILLDEKNLNCPTGSSNVLLYILLNEYYSTTTSTTVL